MRESFSSYRGKFIKRKENQLKVLKKDLDINSLKMRFINDVINDIIVIYRNKKDNIIKTLSSSHNQNENLIAYYMNKNNKK